MQRLGQNNIYQKYLGSRPIVKVYKGSDIIADYTTSYVPPVDWQDIRKDCPENSIALYAAHGTVTTPNYTIEKVTGPTKYTKVGNPTINNGVVSGFSANDYITTSSVFPFNTASNWTIVIKCTTVPRETGNTQQRILSSGGIFLRILGSSWNLYLNEQQPWGGNISDSPFVKLERDGDTLHWYTSGDGVSWSEKTSVTATGLLDEVVKFGGSGSTASWDGSLDLNETYIKVNNQMWFGSQVQLTSANPDIYLESSGTQYIDTGVKADNNTGLLIKASVCSNNYTDNLFVGSRNDSGDTRFSLDFDWSVGGKMIIGYNAYYSTSFSSLGLSAGQDCVCSLNFKNDRAAKVNNTLCKSLEDITLVSQTGSLYMFKWNYSSSYPYTGKIYNLQISQGSSIIRHFVPVPAGLGIGNFTVPSNGMWDIVEQKFYPNLGTGNFTYGGADNSTTYDNLGFIATCAGGYKVFIDGNQYGSTYTSGSKCSIVWSSANITTGRSILTPTNLIAHKVWVVPATTGNNITGFHCSKVAASGNEQQGILWAHYNLTNSLTTSLYDYGNYWQPNLFAITAKNNVLHKSQHIDCLINQSSDLGNNCSRYIEYLPKFNSPHETSIVDLQVRSATAKLKSVTLIGNATYSLKWHSFQGSTGLEEIKTVKPMTTTTNPYLALYNNQSIKKLPDVDYSNAEDLGDFLTNAIALEDTILDVRAATKLNKIGCYGSSQYFMSGFKGLRVSNEAPFDNNTSPKVNVSYTGMDRNALVQLFNDLPYNNGYTVVGSPTIVGGLISSFALANYLSVSNNTIDNEFEFYTKLNPATSNPSGQVNMMLFDGYGFGIFAFANGSIVLQIKDTDGNYRVATLGTTSDTIYVKSIVTPTKVEVYTSSDGNTYTLKSTLNYAITSLLNKDFWIGRTSNSYTGSIDLNNTYIKVNGITWFKGSATRQLDTTATNVGGVTINNGVASGFSSSKYISYTSKFTQTNYNNFISNGQFIVCFKTPATLVEEQLIYIPTGGTYAGLFTRSNGNLVWQISGTDYRVSVGTGTLSANTTYWCKGVLSNNTAEIFLSTDGINYTSYNTLDLTGMSTPATYDDYIKIGVDGLFSRACASYSIDLNNTSITIGNSKIFAGMIPMTKSIDCSYCTGAGALTNEDKAIVSNKNWSLTADVAPTSTLTFYVPQGSNVNVNGTDYTPTYVNNQWSVVVTLNTDSTYSYTVSKTGYLSDSGSGILDGNIAITLVAVTGTGASFNFNNTGYDKILVEPGTEVSYAASQSGYISYYGSQVIYEDTELKMAYLIVNIDPTPDTVTINGISGDKLLFLDNTTFNYTVVATKTNYQTLTLTGTITTDATLYEYMEGAVIFESSTPGTYTLTLTEATPCEIHVVGAGAGGGYYQIGMWSGKGGGSGCYANGSDTLSAGTYTLVVGAGSSKSSSGNIAAGGTTYISYDNTTIMSASGGKSHAYNSEGEGGTDVYSSLSISQLYIGQNASSTTGGASMYNGYGKGGNGGQTSAENGVNGYIKITTM